MLFDGLLVTNSVLLEVLSRCWVTDSFKWADLTAVVLCGLFLENFPLWL